MNSYIQLQKAAIFFSIEPLSKTGYWLGVCHGWFHLQGLTGGVKNASWVRITKLKSLAHTTSMYWQKLMILLIYAIHDIRLTPFGPREGPGGKDENLSSVSPACRKRRLKGRCVWITVWKGWSCVGAWTGTLKNPAKCLWRWEHDRRYNFFFILPAQLIAVTCMTEISFIVTLINQFTSFTSPFDFVVFVALSNDNEGKNFNLHHDFWTITYKDFIFNVLMKTLWNDTRADDLVTLTVTFILIIATLDFVAHRAVLFYKH